MRPTQHCGDCGERTEGLLCVWRYQGKYLRRYCVMLLVYTLVRRPVFAWVSLFDVESLRCIVMVGVSVTCIVVIAAQYPAGQLSGARKADRPVSHMSAVLLRVFAVRLSGK